MDVQALFCVAGAMDSAPCKRSAKSVGFAAVSQTMRGADLKRARKKKTFRVAGGQGADVLRWVTFWSIRSSGLLRRFCVTGAVLRMTFSWQAQYFRDMGWKNRKMHWYELIVLELRTCTF